MAVKKAKDASFKRMDSAYASSKSAIKKIKNADPLNAKEERSFLFQHQNMYCLLLFQLYLYEMQNIIQISKLPKHI